MKILLAPLNWGLGHASRCVPLVRRLLDQGHEVVLGGDGESLTLLRKHFPTLRYVHLAPLNLRYSSGQRQVWAMVKALPKLIAWAIKDHTLLQAVLREEPFDQVISDNRFGLYINPQSSIVQSSVDTVYITHQLHIFLPAGWRWAEPVAERWHARIARRFHKVWVPDFAEQEKSLAGELSHPTSFNFQSSIFNRPLKYLGPLSRFEQNPTTPDLRTTPSIQPASYDVVAVLSGLEPQRTLLEKSLIARYEDSTHSVLIVQGLLHRPPTRLTHRNITIVPYMADNQLAHVLTHAQRIIARSGYSTIMDLYVLGVLSKAELIPTPGQPEQEYLAARHVQPE